MTIREILTLPDQRLRTKAQPVAAVDQAIRDLVADMFETMYHDNGVGLAATQINVHKRVIVMDVSQEQNQPLCLINPEITATEGKIEMDEGCLSVPEAFAKVTRAEKVTVQALNEQGESYELKADGLLARCVLHEIDHINGKLFIDYLSSLKRQMILKKLKKLKKHAQAV